MFLSKRSNGIYYIFYKSFNGKRNCKSTGSKTISEARKFLSAFESSIQEIKEKKIIPITFKKMSFEFLVYSCSVHSYNHTISMRGTFKRMLIHFGDIKVEYITKQKLMDYLQDRSRTVTPYTIKREIECFSSLCNWAIDRQYMLENLCKGIKRPRLPEKLPVFFTKWEFDELILHTSDEDLRDIFIVAVNTGLRQMEIITLEWNQVDLENKLIILHNRNHLTKSKRIRSLPLNKNAFEILEKRFASSEKITQVFTYHKEPFNQQFISHKTKKLIKAAKINPKLNFHSLRHTFASWLVQKGVSIYEVSRLLGHSDVRVTQIYAHLRSDDLRNAVELLG